VTRPLLLTNFIAYCSPGAHSLSFTAILRRVSAAFGSNPFSQVRHGQQLRISSQAESALSSRTKLVSVERHLVNCVGYITSNGDMNSMGGSCWGFINGLEVFSSAPFTRCCQHNS